MPILEKCCFCAQLQTGAVILGWLGIISSVFSIVMSFLGITFMEEVVVKITEMNQTANAEKVQTIYLFLLISSILLNVVILASSVCLLTGAVKRQRLLLVPWLICESIAILFLGISLIGHLVATFIVEQGALDEFLSFLLTGVLLGIEVYLWLCVYSLFHQIRKEDPTVHYGASTQSAVIKHDPKDGLPAYTTVA